MRRKLLAPVQPGRPGARGGPAKSRTAIVLALFVTLAATVAILLVRRPGGDPPPERSLKPADAPPVQEVRTAERPSDWPPPDVVERLATVQDVRTTRRPMNGHFVERDANGRPLQETVWRDDRVVDGWEMYRDSRFVGDRYVIAPPAWTHVVKGGSGRLTMFDRQGRNQGSEVFAAGVYVGGVH